MPDSWIGDFGIRVTNLKKSLEFYTTILDLVELRRVEDEDSAYVLLKDRRSGQRIELNWYAEKSPFYAPYVPGEGLDHIEVRVKSVPEFLEWLRGIGVLPVTKKLWVNSPVVQKLRSDPKTATWPDLDVWTTSTGHRVAYISDPDGNMIALYDHPEESWDGPIPDHY
jgi:catechol 2,3-dioxygenase-like lactoylglutathione lyase family enzyme